MHLKFLIQFYISRSGTSCRPSNNLSGGLILLSEVYTQCKQRISIDQCVGCNGHGNMEPVLFCSKRSPTQLNRHLQLFKTSI